jgi:hypothetical protein
MTALTVFLAPDGPADGVLDVLADLSGGGLIDPFLWVAASDVTTTGAGAVEIERGGRRTRTSIQEALADRRPTIVRLCVVVPISVRPEAVDVLTERRLAEFVEFAGGGASMTRIRCVVTRPGATAGPDLLARNGWHNVLVAPEDANGPAANRQVLPPTDDRVEIGRHAATTIAGLLALWTGLDDCPLDGRPVESGVRVARAFHRRIDASDVERELRAKVLATRPHLPLPRDHTAGAVYIEDVGPACARMADALWARHRHTLMGRRVQPVTAPSVELTWRTALSWLFRYIWANLRNAPADWYRAGINATSIGIARRVHAVVFGTGRSAYQVVVNRMTARELPAGWQDLGDAAGQLEDLLAQALQHEPHARVDLRPMWIDFAGGALTLADGGRRNPGMPPITIGPQPAVLASVTDAAPGPQDDYSALTGHLAARVDMDRVQAGDVLGADLLRQRLRHVGQRDPLVRADADHVLHSLSTWSTRQEQSYAVQVGTCIAGALMGTFGEIQQYLRFLADAAAPRQAGADGAGGTRHRRSVWLMRILAVLALAAAVTGTALGIAGTVPPRVAVLVVVGPVAAWLAVVIARFVAEQRRIFQELTAEHTLVSHAEAAIANLRQAVQDARRLGDAYDQYLLWSRAVAVVLQEPFGPLPPSPRRGLEIQRGLPRGTRTATVTVREMDVGAAAAALRADLFFPGWLSDLWAAHLRGAGAQLRAPELIRDPDLLFQLNGGAIAGSYLYKWAASLSREGTTATPGEQAWQAVLTALEGSRAALADVLLSAVRPVGGAGEVLSLDEFLAGIDRPAGGQQFAAALFTPTAQAADRSRVVTHAPDRSTAGLSRAYSLVQLSEAARGWELAVASRDGGDDDGPVPGVPSAPPAPAAGGSRVPVRAEPGKPPAPADLPWVPPAPKGF